MNVLRTMLVLGFLAGITLAGDADMMRREEVVKAMIASMGQMSKILASVKDEDTAKSARPQLKKAADAWLALRKKADSLPPPSKSEAELLSKAYKDQLEQAKRKLDIETARVQKLPGGREALEDLAKALAVGKKKGS